MSEKDFDKGYKSGFQFGKEVANEEWMNRIKQAREEIDDLDYLINDAKYSDQETRAYNVDSLVTEFYEIMDKLIAESET